MAWTADDLLTTVKARAQLPATNGKLADARILEFADEIIATRLAEVLREAKAEYGVTGNHTTATAAGTKDYRIPTRAQGANVREVKLEDASGNSFDVPAIDLEDVDAYEDGSSWWWANGVACAVVGDFVRIAPTPNSADWTLRIYYHRRPSKLVSMTDSKVALIDTVTSTTEVEVASANHTTGDKVDVVQANPNFDSLGDDRTLTVAGTTYTFDDAVDDDMAAGDYVVDAGYTPVPQVPAELHPALTRLLLVDVLEAIGGTTKALSTAETKADQALESARSILSGPRIQGAAQKIINRDSPLRSARGGWGRG